MLEGSLEWYDGGTTISLVVFSVISRFQPGESTELYGALAVKF